MLITTKHAKLVLYRVTAFRETKQQILAHLNIILSGASLVIIFQATIPGYQLLISCLLISHYERLLNDGVNFN